MDKTGEDWDGLHLGKFEKLRPTFFQIYVSLYQNIIYTAGKPFSVVVWPWFCKWCLELIIYKIKQNYLKYRDLAPFNVSFECFRAVYTKIVVCHTKLASRKVIHLFCSIETREQCVIITQFGWVLAFNFRTRPHQRSWVFLCWINNWACVGTENNDNDLLTSSASSWWYLNASWIRCSCFIKSQDS